MQVLRRARACPLPAGARPARRASTSSDVVGQLQRAEEPDPVIARHASGSRVTCLSRLCRQNAARGAAPRRSPARGSSPGRRGSRAAVALAHRPGGVHEDEPDGLLVGPAAGPAIPSPRPRRRRRAARARRAPSPPRPRPRRRRARRAAPRGRRAARPWPRSHTRSRRRGRRRSSPGRRSAGRRRGRRCTTRPSTSVRPRSRSSSSTSSAVADLALREQEPPGVRDQLPLDRRRRAPPRPARRTGRRAARSPARRSSTSTPSPSPPAAASERAIADSRDAVEAEHAPLRTARALEERGAAARSRARAARAPAARAAGPAARPRRRRRASSTTAGAVPTRPIQSAPSGSVACFVTPSAKSPYGRLRRAAIRAGTLLDRVLERLLDVHVDPSRLREQLDRAVVVRRAEAARDDEQVVARGPRRAQPRGRPGRRRRR